MSVGRHAVHKRVTERRGRGGIKRGKRKGKRGERGERKVREENKQAMNKFVFVLKLCFEKEEDVCMNFSNYCARIMTDGKNERE